MTHRLLMTAYNLFLVKGPFQEELVLGGSQRDVRERQDALTSQGHQTIVRDQHGHPIALPKRPA